MLDTPGASLFLAMVFQRVRSLAIDWLLKIMGEAMAEQTTSVNESIAF